MQPNYRLDIKRKAAMTMALSSICIGNWQASQRRWRPFETSQEIACRPKRY